MNILKRLPDDIQEIIYYKLHQLNTKNIEVELNNEIDKRWNKKSHDTQNDYIETFYKFKNVSYSLYDGDNDSFFRLDKVFYYGKCRIIYDYNEGDDEYISPILTNPTYEDILLEADKIIDISGDYNNNFLEDVLLRDKIFDEDSKEYIQTIDIFLGS